MQLSWLFTSSMIGIDVQRDAVRFIELVHKDKRLQVARKGLIHTQHTVFKGDLIEDWHGLGSALTELVVVNHLQNKKVVVCIPASQAILASCEPMDRKKTNIDASIQRWIKNNHSRLEVNEMHVDYYLEKSGQVYFAAARREYLQRLCQTMMASGLAIKAIDVDVYALRRAIQYELLQKHVMKQVPLVLAYIDMNGMHIMMWSNEKIISCKRVGFYAWYQQVKSETEIFLDEFLENNASIIIMASDDIARQIASLLSDTKVKMITSLSISGIDRRESVEFAMASGLAMHGLL